MIPNVLSIAGSDPSGGAGIQADIKAISGNSAFAMAAVTALTAQNTQGVIDIHFVPPDFVSAQIKTIFDDIRVDAVKIGMIANAEIAGAVAFSLETHTAPIVLDPVMIAKGGARLLQTDAINVITSALLPRATLLTPNLEEAAYLLGGSVATTLAGMEEQGRALLGLGPRAVLMKGGHLNSEDSPDCLITAQEIRWFESRRIMTRNTHGSGCTLSSALAAHIARGRDLSAAVAAAKSYVTNAIAHADDLSVGTGHGPTHHFAAFYDETEGVHT